MSIYQFMNQTVSVKRQSTTGGSVSAPSTVIASMQCLIEPIATRDMESIMGRVPSAVYRMTWGSEDVRTNDTITWNGASYILKETLPDTLRGAFPYQTGILTRVAGGR